MRLRFRSRPDERFPEEYWPSGWSTHRLPRSSFVRRTARTCLVGAVRSLVPALKERGLFGPVALACLALAIAIPLRVIGNGMGPLLLLFGLGLLLLTLLLYVPALLIVGVAHILILVGLVIALGASTVATQGQVAKGTVVGGPDIAEEYLSSMVVEFWLPDEQRIRFVDDGLFSSRVRVGDEVTVFYRSGEPDAARVNSWPSVWGWTFLSCGLGLAASILAFHHVTGPGRN